MANIANTLTIDLDTVKLHLHIDDTDEDVILTHYRDAAIAEADEYCVNPFITMKSVIIFDGVVAGEMVAIRGTTFTAAAAEDFEEHEFAVGTDNATDSASLVSAINSPYYGITNVRATAVELSGGAYEITLSWYIPESYKVTAFSSYDSLDVRDKAVDVPIPDVITVWCLERIARLYEMRISGLTSETLRDIGSASFGEVDYSLLNRYRLSPGLG